MKDPFQKQFEELHETYAQKFADDESELAADDYLHWFGAYLSPADREFLNNFIDEWQALAVRHTEFFTCFECSKTNLPMNFSEIEGARYCNKCRPAKAMGDGQLEQQFQMSLF